MGNSPIDTKSASWLKKCRLCAVSENRADRRTGEELASNPTRSWTCVLLSPKSKGLPPMLYRVTGVASTALDQFLSRTLCYRLTGATVVHSQLLGDAYICSFACTRASTKLVSLVNMTSYQPLVDFVVSRTLVRDIHGRGAEPLPIVTGTAILWRLVTYEFCRFDELARGAALQRRCSASLLHLLLC